MTIQNEDDDYAFRDPDDTPVSLMEVFDALAEGLGSSEEEKIKEAEYMPEKLNMDSSKPHAMEAVAEKEKNSNPLSTKEELEKLLARQPELLSGSPEQASKVLDEEIKGVEADRVLTEGEIEKSIKKMKELGAALGDDLKYGRPLDAGRVNDYGTAQEELKRQQEKMRVLNTRLALLSAEKTEMAGDAKSQAEEADHKGFRELSLAISNGAAKILRSLRDGLADIGNYVHNCNEAFKNGARDAYNSIGDKCEALYAKLLLQQQAISRQVGELVNSLSRKKETVKTVTTEKAQSVIRGEMLRGEKAQNNATRASLSEMIGRAQKRMKTVERTEGAGRSLMTNARHNFALESCQRDIARISEVVGDRIGQMEENQAKGRPIDRNELVYLKGLKDVADGRLLSEERMQELTQAMKKHPVLRNLDPEKIAEKMKTLTEKLEGKTMQSFTRKESAPER